MAQHNVIKDTGEHFTIDTATRKVKVPTTHRVIGTEGDHMSEQIIFKCPELVDGHEVANCGRKYISWLNTEGTPGHDELKVARTEDGSVYFAWDIRDGLTLQRGVVQFSIHFEDVNEEGMKLYRWSTTACKECEILESINAALGAYAAVYVDGDTLVFADYSPVENDTLAIESPGIFPEGTLTVTEEGIHDVSTYARVDVQTTDGTLTITENGTHDVRRFKEAKVEIKTEYQTPTITVNGAGKVTATANGKTAEHQLTVADDPELIPANIWPGVNILGVEGAAVIKRTATAVGWDITPASGYTDAGFIPYVITLQDQGLNSEVTIKRTTAWNGYAPVSVGLFVILQNRVTATVLADIDFKDLECIESASDADRKEFVVFRVTGEAPYITATVNPRFGA